MLIDTNQWLNLTDASIFCGYKSRNTFYYMIANDKGPPFETFMGTRWFHIPSLEAWKATRRPKKRRGQTA